MSIIISPYAYLLPLFSPLMSMEAVMVAIVATRPVKFTTSLDTALFLRRISRLGDSGGR